MVSFRKRVTGSIRQIGNAFPIGTSKQRYIPSDMDVQRIDRHGFSVACPECDSKDIIQSAETGECLCADCGNYFDEEDINEARYNAVASSNVGPIWDG